MFGVEGCGHFLHLIAGDVDLPCGYQLVEDGGESRVTVASDGGAPSIADVGCEAEAAGEPRLRRSATVAGSNPVKLMASACDGLVRGRGSSGRPASEEGDELVQR